MSGVSSVTAQLTSLQPCGDNCCDKIDALNGAVARLGARIQALEDSGGQDRDSLLSEIKRLGGLLDQKANASDFAGLQDDLGLLGATIAALQAVVGTLKAGFDFVSEQVGNLLRSLASSGEPAKATANEALAIAQNALILAQKAIVDATGAVNVANLANTTANRAIEITNSTAQQVSGAISQASEALSVASKALTAANSAVGTADRAIGIAEPLPIRMRDVEAIAAGAKATADRAVDIATLTASKPGIAGATGAQGIPGLIGATGAQGIAGLIGATGAQGIPGATGAQGIPGAIGATGVQGVPGATGAQGIPGLIGSGAQGIPGAIGAQGIPGAIGATGAQGIPGAIGATGAPAKDIDPTLPGRVGTLESKIATVINRPEILTPDKPGTIPIRYPTTGTIVHVPTDDYVQGEFVEEKKKITKLGGDLEPLKNDNNENKRKIAVIQQNCCKPQDETKPKVELETASITQFVNCDPNTGKPVFSVIGLPVVKGTGMTETAKSLQIARVNALECKECDAIATVPEWWQIPIENYRPQLIVIYRVLNEDGTFGGTQYAITIPNPNKDYAQRPATKPSFPEYIKGNYQEIFRLKDNTKLIVNCKDDRELKTLMTTLISTIEKEKLPEKSYKTVIHPEGTFNQARVRAWRVDYYAMGRGGTSPRGIKPNWVWRL